jgi:D-beta-D-heptose 7-phosphate kinase / D-beta-D-heptose 1-phosphate adenosyltransferase
MDTLLHSLSRWKPFKALVVGDFMLDQHIYGDAERLSPDAPVPILHVRRQDQRPGGAANVCLDLVALKGSAIAIGVTGDDTFGRLMREALTKEHIDATHLVADPARPTTVKQNLVGLAQARHPQKMFRVDFESREPLSTQVEDAILAAFTRALPGVDVVCIEDYNKGVCTPRVCQAVIAAAKRANKPVFVDPAKIADYSKYRGASAITPNRQEAELAAGMKTDGDASVQHNSKVAKVLLDQLDLEAAVLTLDRHGALLLAKDSSPLSIPTQAREVYDVTGAGDMFLAGLAAARANGIDWHDSVRFANAAAGLEVEVFGVQPIPLERVHHAVLMQSNTLAGKLRTLDQLKVEVDAVRRTGKRIVFTNGCFDILHAGHVTLLDKARREGDYLVVAINEDASVRALKGPTRPVNNQDDRARVLGGLGCVDSVVFFGEDTPLNLIHAIRPDVLVKGGDYTKSTVVGADFVESYGGRVALIDLVEGKSTTATINRMREQA